MASNKGIILLIGLAALAIFYKKKQEAGNNSPDGSPPVKMPGGTNDTNTGIVPTDFGPIENVPTSHTPPGEPVNTPQPTNGPAIVVEPGKTIVIVTSKDDCERGTFDQNKQFIIKDAFGSVQQNQQIPSSDIIATDATHIYWVEGRFVIRIPLTNIAYLK